MHFARQLFLYIAITSFLFLIAGLVKPWIMLWWEHVQNRRKVIKVYGLVSVCSIIIYYALTFVSE